MTTITETINEQKLGELLQRTLSDVAANYVGVMVVVGRKLGLYRALAGQGPLTSQEVADRAGCAERYVREWLASQVASRYIDYHPDTGRYELSPEQTLVLADETSAMYMPLAWEVPASMWHDEPKTLEAFRTGNGVAWGDHHPRLFNGVAAFYRNGYQAAIVQDWLPALTGVVEKLEAGATVADIGCGFGYSTVFMAQAFPASRFVGIDNHAESIEKAREIARENGVTNVEFIVGEIDETPGKYDLVCFFDCLHDVGDPLTMARDTRRLLVPDGSVMLVEPFANDRLEDNIGDVGRLYYAASTTLCVAHSLSEDGTALGAQAGEARLAEVFSKAGYRTFNRARQTPFNLIFEART